MTGVQPSIQLIISLALVFMCAMNSFIVLESLKKTFGKTPSGYGHVTFTYNASSLAWLGLVIIYFIYGNWYMPIIAALASIVMGSVLVGLFSRIFPRYIMIVISFITWPICSYWFYRILVA